MHHLNKYITSIKSIILHTFVAEFETVEFTRFWGNFYPEILLVEREGTFRDSVTVVQKGVGGPKHFGHCLKEWALFLGMAFFRNWLIY